MTALKAMFDETWVLPDAVVASDDGSELLDYEGDELTVGGELDKLTAKIAGGRNAGGVHYRSDCRESLKLGEAVAVLKQQSRTYRELADLEFTGFDGNTISI